MCWCSGTQLLMTQKKKVMQNKTILARLLATLGSKSFCQSTVYILSWRVRSFNFLVHVSASLYYLRQHTRFGFAFIPRMSCYFQSKHNLAVTGATAGQMLTCLTKVAAFCWKLGVNFVFQTGLNWSTVACSRLQYIKFCYHTNCCGNEL